MYNNVCVFRPENLDEFNSIKRQNKTEVKKISTRIRFLLTRYRVWILNIFWLREYKSWMASNLIKIKQKLNRKSNNIKCHHKEERCNKNMSSGRKPRWRIGRSKTYVRDSSLCERTLSRLECRSASCQLRAAELPRLRTESKTSTKALPSELARWPTNWTCQHSISSLFPNAGPFLLNAAPRTTTAKRRPSSMLSLRYPRSSWMMRGLWQVQANSSPKTASQSKLWRIISMIDLCAS